MDAAKKHAAKLHYYATNPGIFGLQQATIESVLIEPIWYKANNFFYTEDYESLCDIIYLLQGNKAVPCEVKKSRNKYEKAYNQVLQGKIYSEEVLGRSVDAMVVAYYQEKSQPYDLYKL